MTEPTEKVRARVTRRDSLNGVPVCQWCGLPIGGLGHSLQHRRARGMGGSSDPESNLPGNLVLVCGSATTGCHGFIESHPGIAQLAGYRVPQGVDPTLVLIRTATHGDVYLTNDGTIRGQEAPIT